MAFKIAMFSDFVCPFCYIGLALMEKLEPEFGFELDWHGFEIHPEWPQTGMAPENLYRSLGVSPEALWEQIRLMARQVGLKMNPPPVLSNSHSALLAAEYAHECGKGGAFDERVYRAYFQEAVNIGELGELKRLATDVGLDPDGVEEAIGSPRYALRLKNNNLIAHQRGVTGVPTFFIGDFPVVGAQSEDTMRKILARQAQMAASK